MFARRMLLVTVASSVFVSGALEVLSAQAPKSATPAQAVAPAGPSAAAGQPAPAWEGSQLNRLSRRAEMYYEGVWGVGELRVKVAESGELIRFNYRVLDPAKAAALNDKKAKPELDDAQAGVKLSVPQMEKIGDLRQSSTPKAGMTYWMAFANPTLVVKRGHRVDVVIGSFRANNLVVEWAFSDASASSRAFSSFSYWLPFRSFPKFEEAQKHHSARFVLVRIPMSRKVVMTITMFLAAAGAWAQSPAAGPSRAATPPVISTDSNISASVISRLGRNKNAGAAQGQLAPGQRLQEMESTRNGMRALLKQMQAENASSASKCPIARANLVVWELLLSHLDREFQLQIATAAREDVEARRAALYNQAFSKAEVEAAAAGQTPPAPSTSVAP
jgi:hypothetical protein